jgi:alpha-glucosidase
MNVSINYYINSVLPLDAQWVDVDYMNNFTDFTLNPRFGNLSGFVADIKEKGVYSVVKLNTGLAQKNTSDIYQDAVFNGSLLMDQYGNPLTGAGWAGDVVYLDMFNETTSVFWPKWLQYLTREQNEKSLGIDFDGLWLDDSEIYSECTG